MGRGRAKAKQTKVARELKYFSPNTDFSSLERELHTSTSRDTDHRPEVVDGEEHDDYSKWASGEH